MKWKKYENDFNDHGRSYENPTPIERMAILMFYYKSGKLRSDKCKSKKDIDEMKPKKKNEYDRENLDILSAFCDEKNPDRLAKHIYEGHIGKGEDGNFISRGARETII